MLNKILKLQLVSPVSVGVGGHFCALLNTISGIHNTIPFWALCPLWCLIFVPVCLFLPVILPIFLLYALQKGYQQRGIPNYYDPSDSQAMSAAQSPEEAKLSTIKKGEKFNSLAEQRAAHARAYDEEYRKEHQAKIDALYETLQQNQDPEAWLKHNPAKEQSLQHSKAKATNTINGNLLTQDSDLTPTYDTSYTPYQLETQPDTQVKSEFATYHQTSSQSDLYQNPKQIPPQELNIEQESCELCVDCDGNIYYGAEAVAKFEQSKARKAQQESNQGEFNEQSGITLDDGFSNIDNLNSTNASNELYHTSSLNSEQPLSTKQVNSARTSNSLYVATNVSANFDTAANNTKSTTRSNSSLNELSQSHQEKAQLNQDSLNPDPSNQESLDQGSLGKSKKKSNGINVLQAMTSAINNVVSLNPNKSSKDAKDNEQANFKGSEKAPNTPEQEQYDAQTKAKEEAFARASQAQDHSEYIDGYLIKPCNTRQNIDNFIRINIMDNLLQNKYLLIVSLFMYWIVLSVVIYGVSFFSNQALERFRTSAMLHQVLKIVTPDHVEYVNTMITIVSIGGAVLVMAMLCVFVISLVSSTGCLYPNKVVIKMFFKNLPSIIVMFCFMYSIMVFTERHFANYLIEIHKSTRSDYNLVLPSLIFMAIRLYVIYVFLNCFILGMMMSLRILPEAYLIKPKPKIESGSRTRSVAFKQDLARREYTSWRRAEKNKHKKN